jgi:hypothetical protein
LPWGLETKNWAFQAAGDRLIKATFAEFGKHGAHNWQRMFRQPSATTTKNNRSRHVSESRDFENERLEYKNPSGYRYE